MMRRCNLASLLQWAMVFLLTFLVDLWPFRTLIYRLICLLIIAVVISERHKTTSFLRKPPFDKKTHLWQLNTLGGLKQRNGSYIFKAGIFHSETCMAWYTCCQTPFEMQIVGILGTRFAFSLGFQQSKQILSLNIRILKKDRFEMSI